MQRTLFFKILTIGLLTLLLMIPIAMTGDLVMERQQRQNEVTRDIAASYAGSQRIVGPILALPWRRTRIESTPAILSAPATTREITTTGVRYIFPADLNAAGNLSTDAKSRGLFSARVYQWQGRFSGRFALPRLNAEEDGGKVKIHWGQPYLVVALDDPRGIIGQPQLEWGGQTFDFERGSRLKLQARGIHAALPKWPHGERTVDFNLKIALRGTEHIAFVPLGDNNHFSLDSSWPHPSFSGRYLPDPESQQVSKDGFRATWTISALAADAANQLRNGEARCDNPCSYTLDSMNIELVEPVNIYSLSDRALKYGHLFIVLTFAAFFIFEALKRLAIHPIQYLLVGLALAVFFLLLISLSEHFAFGMAYALSALACCGLIALYLSTVLGSRHRGLIFGAALAILFAALYLLLRSEDNALMLGSLLIFCLLAAAMMATRKVDWYGLTPSPTLEKR